MSIEHIVREKYGAVAEKGLSSNQAGVKAVAEAFGYSAEQLASIPAEANVGLSCGNPTAFASLQMKQWSIWAAAAVSMCVSRPRRSGRKARRSA